MAIQANRPTNPCISKDIIFRAGVIQKYAETINAGANEIPLADVQNVFRTTIERIMALNSEERNAELVRYSLKAEEVDHDGTKVWSIESINNGEVIADQISGGETIAVKKVAFNPRQHQLDVLAEGTDPLSLENLRAHVIRARANGHLMGLGEKGAYLVCPEISAVIIVAPDHQANNPEGLDYDNIRIFSVIDAKSRGKISSIATLKIVAETLLDNLNEIDKKWEAACWVHLKQDSHGDLIIELIRKGKHSHTLRLNKAEDTDIIDVNVPKENNQAYKSRLDRPGGTPYSNSSSTTPTPPSGAIGRGPPPSGGSGPQRGGSGHPRVTMPPGTGVGGADDDDDFDPSYGMPPGMGIGGADGDDSNLPPSTVRIEELENGPLPRSYANPLHLSSVLPPSQSSLPMNWGIGGADDGDDAYSPAAQSPLLPAIPTSLNSSGGASPYPSSVSLSFTPFNPSSHGPSPSFGSAIALPPFPNSPSLTPVVPLSSSAPSPAVTVSPVVVSSVSSSSPPPQPPSATPTSVVTPSAVTPSAVTPPVVAVSPLVISSASSSPPPQPPSVPPPVPLQLPSATPHASGHAGIVPKKPTMSVADIQNRFYRPSAPTSLHAMGEAEGSKLKSNNPSS